MGLLGKNEVVVFILAVDYDFGSLDLLPFLVLLIHFGVELFKCVTTVLDSLVEGLYDVASVEESFQSVLIDDDLFCFNFIVQAEQKKKTGKFLVEGIQHCPAFLVYHNIL